MRSPKATPLAVAAVAAGIAGLAALAAAAPPPPPPPNAVAPGKYFGASSCTGAACHSSSEPRKDPPHLQEHVTWSAINPETNASVDRHNYAFTRLVADERSAAIMKALNVAEGTAGLADASDRCLSCHGVSVHDYGVGARNPGVGVATRKELQGGRYSNEDGVSCDGCHGPAEKWLRPHTEPGWTRKKWKELGSDKLYDDFGLYYSKDLVLWARQCVRCHLAIDTNLIDAGHPDLIPFELFGQSQAVPPHWRDYAAASAPGERKDLPAPGAFHGVRVWWTGQAIAVGSSARQLVRRAAGDTKKTYDKTTPEHLRAGHERLLGHWLVLRQVLAIADPKEGEAFAKDMAELRALFAAKPQKAEAIRAVSQRIEDRVKPFVRRLADRPATREEAKALMLAIAKDEKAAVENRRTREQAALGLYALYTSYAQAVPPADPGDDPIRRGIYGMFEGFDEVTDGFRAGLEAVRAGLTE